MKEKKKYKNIHGDRRTPEEALASLKRSYQHDFGKSNKCGEMADAAAWGHWNCKCFQSDSEEKEADST